MQWLWVFFSISLFSICRSFVVLNSFSVYMHTYVGNEWVLIGSSSYGPTFENSLTLQGLVVCLPLFLYIFFMKVFFAWLMMFTFSLEIGLLTFRLAVIVSSSLHLKLNRSWFFIE